MHWKTHKRLLISTVVPVVALAATLLFLFAPKEWYGLGLPYLDFFRVNPLSTALDLLTSLTVLAYLVYLHVGRIHPRHRGFFALGVFSTGMIVNGVYARMLSRTADFFTADGAVTFLASAAVFYCIYRLVVLLPLHTRKWLTPALALILLAAAAAQAWQLHLLSLTPCQPGSPLNIWQEMTRQCG